MQPKFTRWNLSFLCGKAITLLIVFAAFSQLSFGQERTASGAAKAAFQKLQADKQIHLAQMRAASTPSVGRIPAGLLPMSSENIVPDVPNPNSRAFVYNGAGPFQLNKQSLLNTVLTPIGAPVPFGFPGAAAWRTTTNQLYVVDQAAPFTLYIVDTATGVRTPVANCTGVPQANLTGMTWDASTSTMYGVSTSLAVSQIFTINLATGACTPIGSPSATHPGAIQINAAPGGTLFGVDIVNDQLFRWNKTTGVATSIGPLGFNANFGMDGHFDLSNGEYNWAAFNATAFQAQLRVIDTLTGSSTLVGTYGGQVETMGIYTQLLPPCSGTPNLGATQAAANPVCPAVPASVYAQNAQGPGTTYQWQISTTSGTTGFSNISGATGAGHSQLITGPTWFRVIATCTSSGLSDTSDPAVGITLRPPTQCYCNAGATSTAFEKISRVQFKTIDNPSTSTAGYEDFTNISTNVVAGETAPMTVTISGPFSTDQVLVWIDFNQNGSFTDPGENVWTSAQGPGPHTGNITIPASATSGSTRMRIRMHDAAAGPNNTPCGNSTYGQVEDYTVNISPCIQGAITSQPANQTAQCSGSATFTVGATGSVLTWEWEYRVSPTSPWLFLTNGGTNPTVSGATTNAVTLSSIPSTWNGYEVRGIVRGPCTAPIFTNAATLTVGPLVASTNITSANICNGQSVNIRLTNVPVTTTTTFNSGTISVPIPDNSLAGASHTMPVTLPAGSVISNIRAQFSIPNHTWPGDLVVVLRDPANNIINLDYYISGTGAGPGSGMVNTQFNSAGGPLLSSSSSPYTGIFRADAQMTPGPGLGPAGPTGFLPTTNNWTPILAGAGTGNWTIAVYDGFGLDVGTLTNWQLHITYGAAATGTWTSNPATPNTMFTNAALTTPYIAGSQASQIWVNPTVNTTYCVTYATTNPACTSAPTCIPVNVFNPISNLQVSPANPKVCVGNNITLSATNLGGPTSYQWEVSVNGGLTWTAIAGATGSSLTLNNVTAIMNNNRYRVTAAASPCASSVTSAVQILKVDLLPVVTISSPVLQITPGGQTTITASSDTTVPANNYTWFLNGNQLSSTTNSVVADMNAFGNYQASVVDKNGCVGTSNVLVIGGQTSDRLWIFPNPTNDGRFQVRLYYDGVQLERRKIMIYTMKGQKVAEKWFDLNRGSSPYMEMSFDLRHLPNGTYVVKVNEQYLLAQEDDVKNEVSGLLLIQR